MLKATLALVAGFVILLIAAWQSGSTGEICEATNTGREQCAGYNLAPFLIIQIFKILHTLEGAITALATAAIACFTWTLWKSNEKMWEVTKIAADAAKRSAEVADRALTLTDRPWVDLRIEIVGPLVFDPVEGCKLDVKLTLLNIGRSPAIGLGVFISLLPSINQAVDSHDKMIKNLRFMFSETSFGHTRFPGDPLEKQIMLTVTRDKIETGIQESESKLVEPYIVACAYYGLPTGGKFRYTSVNRAIFLKDNDLSFSPEGEYPADRLVLSSFNPGETT